MSITLIIIIITSGLSILAFNREELFYRLKFNPYRVRHNKEWHRFITHAFLHANWLHLIANMLVLYFFGPNVESLYEFHFGAKAEFYFILLYVGGILFSSLTTYKKYMEAPYYNSVGASGAVSAVLFSSVLFEPMWDICLYGVICLPGIIWAVVYLVYSWRMGRKENDNINHDAHFTGAVFGILFTIALKPRLAVEFFDKITAWV